MSDVTAVLDDDRKPSKGGHAKVHTVALARFAVGVEAFSDTRNDQLEDLKFAAGSPDNDFQRRCLGRGGRGVQRDGAVHPEQP